MTEDAVSLKRLRTYPDNARIHDLGTIAESLEAHGQLDRLLVQRSTGYVLSGNGRLEAMQHLGWGSANVEWIDVDDDTARSIVLVMNRASDVAGYDEDALANLLSQIDTFTGTGFSADEAHALIDAVAAEEQAALEAAMALTEEDRASIEAGYEETHEPGPQPVVMGTNADEDVLANDEDAHAAGMDPGAEDVVTFDPDVMFDGEGEWGLPVIRADMLLGSIETPCAPWIGPTASDFDAASYIYTFSTDSTRDLPWDRTALGFYINDGRFEAWWTDPVRYMQRLLRSGIMAMIEPDYSRYLGFPKTTWLWNVYRSRWLMRFAQEAGIKTIPSLKGVKEPWVFDGLPEHLPVVACEVQSQSTELKDRVLMARHRDDLKWSVAQRDIGTLLVYGPEAAFDALVAKARLDVNAVWVESRTSAWSKKKREMKSGG